MGWFILAQILSVLIAIVSLGRLSEREKDLEMLVLCQQLAILKRKQGRPVKPNRAEKMTLALFTAKLKDVTQRPASRLRDIIRIFQPETVLGWHRELVRRKWTYARQNKGGRPRIDQELRDLILRLARENPRWGYGKIEGELLKLGFQASRTTIRNLLKHHDVAPAPVLRFLIRDNDGTFTAAFDTVFRSQGLGVIPTPFQAPKVLGGIINDYYRAPSTSLRYLN